MKAVNKDNFDSEVLGYEDKLVLVDFWQPSCTHCIALFPYLEELSKKYNYEVRFRSLNVGENRKFAIMQKVMGLPTIKLYLNGDNIETIFPKDASIFKIEEIIKKYI